MQLIAIKCIWGQSDGLFSIKTGKWQASIRNKIESSQLCYSPTNLDINEGPAIGIPYVKGALDGDGARNNSLLLMMMEVRRVKGKAVQFVQVLYIVPWYNIKRKTHIVTQKN